METTKTYEPAQTTTLEGVDLTKRILAAVIDGVIAGIVFSLLNVVLYGLGGIALSAYFLVKDGMNLPQLNGSSPGKYFMKIKVIRLNGQAMDMATSVKRNLMLAIPGLVMGVVGLVPFLGLFMALAISPIITVAALVIGAYELYKLFNSPQHRRWGDEMAGTMVVEA